MTNEKVLEVVARYKKKLKRYELSAKRSNVRRRFGHPEDGLPHVRWALDQIEVFIGEKRRDKAFRWLGFVQGYMAACGIYSIYGLANHNRSDRGTLSTERHIGKK